MDTGDTAWVLTATALVLFMTPGLALFYGGLVRSKNVLGTMMHSIAAIGLVSILWVLIGYTLAFGPDIGLVIGGLDHLGFAGVGAEPSPLAPTIPHSTFAMFQMMFAVITPALIAGAFAERVKFRGYLLFVAIWSIAVYAPLAHWVWGGGFLGAAGLGAIDFAGGTVVHISAGASALAAALYVGKRTGYPGGDVRPAQRADGDPRRRDPVVRLVRLQRRERARRGRARVLGVRRHPPRRGGGDDRLADPRAHPARQGHDGRRRHRRRRGSRRDHAGVRATSVRWPRSRSAWRPGVVCFLAVELKQRLRYDDSLDAVGVHLVGGLVGALLTGVFASLVINPAGADASLAQVGRQAAAAGITLVFAFVATLVILKFVDRTVGFRHVGGRGGDGRRPDRARRARLRVPRARSHAGPRPTRPR